MEIAPGKRRTGPTKSRSKRKAPKRKGYPKGSSRVR